MRVSSLLPLTFLAHSCQFFHARLVPFCSLCDVRDSGRWTNGPAHPR